MTHDKASDHLRPRQRRERVCVDLTGSARKEESSPVPHVVSDRGHASSVHAALASLPRTQRQAIELALLAGLTHDEIA